MSTQRSEQMSEVFMWLRLIGEVGSLMLCFTPNHKMTKQGEKNITIKPSNHSAVMNINQLQITKNICCKLLQHHQHADRSLKRKLSNENSSASHRESAFFFGKRQNHMCKPETHLLVCMKRKHKKIYKWELAAGLLWNVLRQNRWSHRMQWEYRCFVDNVYDASLSYFDYKITQSITLCHAQTSKWSPWTTSVF